MKILAKGNYLEVTPEQGEKLDTSRFLGYRKRKSESKVTVEDNLVNRIVLGREVLSGFSTNSIWGDQDSYYEAVNGLKEYQILDVEKMYSIRHSLNANPMGLGKTVEAIRYLDNTLGSNSPRVLIVTPKIVRQQWVDQIKKWWGRDATIYEGQKSITPGIWIVNYDKLRNDRVLDKFRVFQWEALILDEAHKIKSRKSKQTLAVKNLPSAHRVALTGTPILRYVDDLWSILNFLDWRYSGISYWNFVNYFCNIKFTPWGNRIEGLSTDPERVSILNRLLNLVCVRNNAIEVAHGKTSETVKLKMSKKQRELYKKEKALLLDELPENCTISNGAVLTTRLRQTTSWPGLFAEGEPGPKFEWILETCINNPEEKFVVFSTFEQTVSALIEYLRKNDIECVKITGKQDAKANELSKKSFIGQRGIRILAGTIGAMGQGFDGLQQACRLMIFVDRDWSPEIMAQAEDRLHRMGQESPVNIYYLECQGSFDQHVGRVNQHKADDIREALKDE